MRRSSSPLVPALPTMELLFVSFRFLFFFLCFFRSPLSTFPKFVSSPRFCPFSVNHQKPYLFLLSSVGGLGFPILFEFNFAGLPASYCGRDYGIVLVPAKENGDVISLLSFHIFLYEYDFFFISMRLNCRLELGGGS